MGIELDREEVQEVAAPVPKPRNRVPAIAKSSRDSGLSDDSVFENHQLKLPPRVEILSGSHGIMVGLKRLEIKPADDNSSHHSSGSSACSVQQQQQQSPPSALMASNRRFDFKPPNVAKVAPMASSTLNRESQEILRQYRANASKFNTLQSSHHNNRRSAQLN